MRLPARPGRSGSALAVASERLLGGASLALTVLTLAVAGVSLQRPPDGKPPAIGDVRLPSCFTPGPVHGLAPRGHAHGVFSLRDRIVVAVTAGRDTTALLELGADGDEGYDLIRVPSVGGRTPGTVRAAWPEGESLVLWTERHRYVRRPEG